MHLLKFFAGLFAVILTSSTGARAATLLVSNTNDSGAGSLRQAIADNSTLGGGNTIVFSNIVTGAITLTNGELLITSSATILGPSPGILSVSGNSTSRVFHITNGVTVTISGLTISNGVVSGSYPGFVGAGFWNDHSTLTLSNCVVTNNQVASGFAGGVFNDGTSGSATLSIIASTFGGNRGNTGGGGIYNSGSGGTANVSINTSTFIQNTGGTSSGGGIYNSGNGGSATLTVSNSTFTQNVCSGNGGGIASLVSTGTSQVRVVGCTFSGNTVSGFGGGLYNHSAGSTGVATLTVVGSTFSSNSAPLSSGSSIYSVGVGVSATLEIGNTILKVGPAGGNIVSGAVAISDGYNLSSDNGNGMLTNTADQINTDPLLGPLANNGGPTFTCPLLPGSPAIDKGKSFGLSTDQRGSPRPFDIASLTNASGGDGSDIGAFELGRPPLSIQSVGSNALLSWPSYYTNYTLQSSTNIVTSNSWITASGAVGLVGNQYLQTNGPISTNRFFRLHGN